ncbi:hypothetical protein [Caulobacter endophyticus]|nr:hypothetical protein [Caulobacter endophyticus]
MKTFVTMTEKPARDRFQGAYWSALMGVDTKRVRAFIAALKTQSGPGSVQ